MKIITMGAAELARFIKKGEVSPLDAVGGPHKASRIGCAWSMIRKNRVHIMRC